MYSFSKFARNVDYEGTLSIVHKVIEFSHDKAVTIRVDGR
jgi:hypothetical protein